MELFLLELDSNASTQFFQAIQPAFYNFFTKATERGRSMRGWSFGNILPVSVPKYHGEKLYVF